MSVVGHLIVVLFVIHLPAEEVLANPGDTEKRKKLHFYSFFVMADKKKFACNFL